MIGSVAISHYAADGSAATNTPSTCRLDMTTVTAARYYGPKDVRIEDIAQQYVRYAMRCPSEPGVGGAIQH